jgi:hypothetical protein
MHLISLVTRGHDVTQVFLTPLRKPGSALSPWQLKAIFSEVEVTFWLVYKCMPCITRSDDGVALAVIRSS